MIVWSRHAARRAKERSGPSYLHTAFLKRKVAQQVRKHAIHADSAKPGQRRVYVQHGGVKWVAGLVKGNGKRGPWVVTTVYPEFGAEKASKTDYRWEKLLELAV